MRLFWMLSAAVVTTAVVTGCENLAQPAEPTAVPGIAAAGPPEAPITMGGKSWQVCTAEQMRKYPPSLDEPSREYYAGPWCFTQPSGTQYTWVYGRPLTDDETPVEVRRYVNEDAQLLVRNLRTTGYVPLAAAVGDRRDVFYLAKRPLSPNVVLVSTLGQNVPPAGQSYTGDDPLRLQVELRKAEPQETVAPRPSP